MAINLLSDYVVVRGVTEDHSLSGIVIPDVAAGKPDRGEVIAVGKGRTLRSGTKVPVAVKPGEQVLFDKYTSNEINLNGETLSVMHESDILAVLEN